MNLRVKERVRGKGEGVYVDSVLDVCPYLASPSLLLNLIALVIPSHPSTSMSSKSRLCNFVQRRNMSAFSGVGSWRRGLTIIMPGRLAVTIMSELGWREGRGEEK
jgi:hypothetical protein